MPYIPQDTRKIFDEHIKHIATNIQHPGELNYVFSKIIKTMLDDGMDYQGLNEVIGVLECAKLELYRKIGSHYEDKAEQKNGSL